MVIADYATTTRDFCRIIKGALFIIGAKLRQIALIIICYTDLNLTMGPVWVPLVVKNVDISTAIKVYYCLFGAFCIVYNHCYIND